jgi:pimeloyl-ACP methyl ester carboxylesterase
MYLEKRVSKSQMLPLRGQRYHIHSWGEADGDRPLLVMMHGWMDVGASFQFVIDAFSRDHHVIAPDWRGYGLTQGPATDNYWFADYLGDLDQLLDHFSPGRPVDLVGHSMGGNVVMTYAGVRPRRIRRLINLEGFGMPRTHAADAPKRMARWLDELQALASGKMDLRAYDDISGVARRLMKTNRRLSQDKADWLARHWSRQNDKGQWEILGDPAHKVINPYLTRLEETLELYRSIEAPVMMVEASDNELGTWYRGKFTMEEFHERLQSVRDLRLEHVADAGHMLHHDQPERLAQLIEDFIA